MSEEVPVRPPRSPRKFNLLRSNCSPLSMYMRRDKEGKLLGWSALRPMLHGAFLLFAYSVVVRYEWTPSARDTLIGILLVLVLEQVAAQVPFSEILHAVQTGTSWLTTTGVAKIREAAAGLGTGVSEVKTEEHRSETTRTVAAPTVVSIPDEEV